MTTSKSAKADNSLYDDEYGSEMTTGSEASDFLWDDDAMYDSERNYADVCDYCADEAPWMWEAGAVLCQMDFQQVRISGEPKLVAARGAYRNGFMGLWMYTKNGESGRFDMSKISDRERSSLIEHIYSNIDGPRKLSDNPPFGLRPVLEFTVDIELDEATVTGCKGESEAKNEEDGRGKDNSGRKQSRKTTKAVKMKFQWETTQDRLP